ncbi:hypothetical protein [Aequorivita sp. KMM 9714]|uniref:hypothetical protein n=1 Tax=Aequorivita sp. KMM 9714 TaxID=2707173 RepID=UPI0013EC753A|nr:hypothetical protein [Aequorivita sp. KMM 9714]NGX84160.1 hypothetical protein [Aequorivita sp. KMM 9714]
MKAIKLIFIMGCLFYSAIGTTQEKNYDQVKTQGEENSSKTSTRNLTLTPVLINPASTTVEKTFHSRIPSTNIVDNDSLRKETFLSLEPITNQSALTYKPSIDSITNSKLKSNKSVILNAVLISPDE